ncbi:TonB-dependent receptor [Aquimarina sp. RZ0]|uniref:TonB-dependent receptor n=1 Tax=Aquimarina sp. RZ0 TaxID=2607730 RepID=UPI0011F38202|nr:TonB-dependent receptor [Aquimarina sp. RZ0]KAA1247102.1 TonB-dependent receptor [Aquimarina sp. RZ0]
MKHKSVDYLALVLPKVLVYILLTGLILLLNSFSKINAQSKGSIIGNISDQFGNLPGAKISIEGLDTVVTTDIDGNYRIEIDPGNYVLTTEFIMYVTISKPAIVKAGETTTVDFLLETGFSIDQPISLGSRSVPNSSLKNTAAVNIITPNEIANISKNELSQVLHYLIPSFHSTNQTIADGTDHIDPASLRGLGPDQVLVLINGKRRHSSSLLNLNGTVGKGSVGTDFNSIPITSIERIEVLRDGAASQYGSDAIAGVINIILKKQSETIVVDNRAGITTEGDGFQVFSAVNFGLNIGEKGFVNVTAEYRNRESINRAGDYNGAVYSNDPIEDQQLITANNFYQQTGYSGRRVMEIGNASTQNLGLSFNGEFTLSADANFYFHGGRNYREGKSKGFYRFPKDQDRVVLELYPNGFSPEILTDIQDDAITMGIKGMRNSWNLDFSHTIGVNRLDYTINRSNNASLGITSPRTFYAGGFVYQQNTTNLDISRTFGWLKGTNIAFGGELRVENYQIIAGEEASYVFGGSTYINEFDEELPRATGAQVFPGFQPENELNKFRTNTSGYLDIEANITDNLLLKGAARYASYNDFGDQIIWKLSSRYGFGDNLSARIGFSTGFRAPSLHQVFFQNISTQFINGESVQVGTFNNESAIVTDALGVDKLKPELSNSFNAGVSGKIHDNFTFALDYYLIDIKDRVVLSGRFSEGYEEIFEPFGVSSVQFLTNAIDSRTSGFDGIFAFKTPINTGVINATLGFNITNTKIEGGVKVPTSLLGEENVLFNREEIARIESGQPNFKLNSLFSYEINKFRFQLVNTYFGEVEYLHPEDGNLDNFVLNEFTGNIETRDQTFMPKLITDIEVSYQFNNYIKLGIGGNNIFDVYPDEHRHSANTENGNFIYSRRVQQFGIRGANYYFKLLLLL